MKLYNSHTRTKETFTPINGKSITMYVCGITPYDTTHLGHAFTYIFFDSLLRYLRFQNYNVIYTQNVTDINDRDNDLLKRAKEQNIPWNKLAEYWTDHFLEDMKKLNWIMPDNYLWASQQIREMTTLIERIKQNGLAYTVNGGVYLDTEKIKDFGKLSGFSKEKMLQFAKDFEEDLENPDKRHPLDVTLWRPTKPDQAANIPSFDSPNGMGRPGWHLECSAMAISSLGEQIDIHGGGIDLIYPHHESEVAQSEGATSKKPFANYWLHTAPVRYLGQKMSKSLGNLVLVSNILKKYSPNVIRYMLLSHHYRESWEFKEEELEEAQKSIDLIEEAIKREPLLARKNDATLQNSKSPSGKTDSSSNFEGQFIEALDDDMNTPKALIVLSEMTKQTEDCEFLHRFAGALGFAL